MFLDWELDGFSFSVYYSQLDAQIRAGVSPGSAFLKWTVTHAVGKVVQSISSYI